MHSFVAVAFAGALLADAGTAQDRTALRNRVVNLLEQRIALAEKMAQTSAKQLERTETQFKSGRVPFREMARIGTELGRNRMVVLDLRIERTQTLDRFAERTPRLAELLELTKKKRAHALDIFERQSTLLKHAEDQHRAGRASLIDLGRFRRAAMAAKLELLTIDQAIAALGLQQLRAKGRKVPSARAIEKGRKKK